MRQRPAPEQASGDDDPWAELMPAGHAVQSGLGSSTLPPAPQNPGRQGAHDGPPRPAAHIVTAGGKATGECMWGVWRGWRGFKCGDVIFHADLAAGSAPICFIWCSSKQQKTHPAAASLSPEQLLDVIEPAEAVVLPATHDVQPGAGLVVLPARDHVPFSQAVQDPPRVYPAGHIVTARGGGGGRVARSWSSHANKQKKQCPT